MLILNFLPIGYGGGLQNSLSFLASLPDCHPIKNIVAVVKENTPIHNKCRELGINVIAVKSGMLRRFLYEMHFHKSFPKGTLCFTLFGPPMLNTKRHFINIIGCAYSNLFYPEIPFWRHLPIFKRIWAEIVDKYRRWSVVRADFWIFETKILEQRAVSLCGFPENRTRVVKMSPSVLVSSTSIMPRVRENYAKQVDRGFRFLFLCSGNPNKRLHNLPRIAHRMIAKTGHRFVFIMTLHSNDTYYKKIMKEAKQLAIEQLFVTVEPVRPEHVSSIIDVCDCMCTFSVLESFSNNFVEAWAMKKPLVVTDADWARDACGNAAIYVDVESCESCAEVLVEVLSSQAKRDELVFCGEKRIASYPTATEKTKQYMDIIDKASLMGINDLTTIYWPRRRGI